MVSVYKSCRNIPNSPSSIALSQGNIVYVIFSMLFVVISTWYLITYSFTFPDYIKYYRYVEEGTSFVRFSTEPISAGMMYILHKLGYSAYEYYFISTFLLHISYVFIAVKIENKSKYFVLFFLIFNPINLILIQTPRYSFSMSMCFYAFFARSNRNALVFILLAFLSHNVMGVFGALFKLTSGMNNYLNLIVVSLSVVFIFLIINGVIPLGFENFATSAIQRGIGRISIFGVFTLYVLSVYKGLSDIKLYLLIMSVFIIVLFFITPFTHRVSSFYLVILTYFLFSQQKEMLNRILNFLFSFGLLAVSFYIFISGSFGYE